MWKSASNDKIHIFYFLNNIPSRSQFVYNFILIRYAMMYIYYSLVSLTTASQINFFIRVLYPPLQIVKRDTFVVCIIIFPVCRYDTVTTLEITPQKTYFVTDKRHEVTSVSSLRGLCFISSLRYCKQYHVKTECVVTASMALTYFKHHGLGLE